MKGHILSLSPGHKEGSRVNISKTYRASRAQCFKGTEGPWDSGIQGIESSPCWQGLSMDLAFPKSKGFQGKYIHQVWPRSKYHRPCIVKPLCDLRPFMGWIGPKGECTLREGIRVWELIIWESADFTLLIIGNPGALVTFFNYIPGLLFPKKIM